ncbi:MAG TPA: tripartite tricarboxylate transporter substrate-binding protein [Candidatus Binatia bacterium]|jgi:tripartite-type tricarboxylate transporter receptor subunit TctC
MQRSPARRDAEFYRGKRIRVLVGTRAGVAYDLYARLIADRIGACIPGEPHVVVENAPAKGAKGVAGEIYSAPADGLTLGAVSPELYFGQLLGRETAFDWSKFSWIGTPERSSHLLHARAATPYDSLRAIIDAKTPARCGASGKNSTAYYLPMLLEELFGARFEMRADYKEGPAVDEGIERGEIDCRVLTISGFFSHEPYHTWRRTGFVRILLQTGAARDPKVPDAPTLSELMNEYRTPDAGRRLAQVILSAASFGRPWIAPPGVPPERLRVLRDAFMRAARDPATAAEAQAKDLELAPASGDELQKLAADVMAQPAEVVARMRKIFAS